LKAALEAYQIPLDIIPADVIAAMIQGLTTDVRKHDLPYGIAHEPKA